LGGFLFDRLFRRVLFELRSLVGLLGHFHHGFLAGRGYISPGLSSTGPASTGTVSTDGTRPPRQLSGSGNPVGFC
jgi:hypothetical protein